MHGHSTSAQLLACLCCVVPVQSERREVRKAPCAQVEPERERALQLPTRANTVISKHPTRVPSALVGAGGGVGGKLSGSMTIAEGLGRRRSSAAATRSEYRKSYLERGFGRQESYMKLERLGEGTYATVFKGKSLVTGYPVALKEVSHVSYLYSTRMYTYVVCDMSRGW